MSEILNMETIGELKEILEEGFDELVSEYLADSPNQLESMKAAAQACDMQALATAAHTLKGSSGNIGVSGVYELCEQLESDAKRGSVEQPAQRIDLIINEYSRAIHALNTLQ